jgi:hypothetical protein
MKSSKFGFLFGFAILLMTVGAGCSKGPQVAEVTGVVTMKGKPMDLILVEFWSSNGPRSYGQTDENGKFTLKLDDGSQPGAIPGSHKVALKDTWPIKDNYLSESGEWVDKSDGKKSRIDTKYYDAMKSPLTVEVKAGEKNNFEFEVDPRK